MANLNSSQSSAAGDRSPGSSGGNILSRLIHSIRPPLIRTISQDLPEATQKPRVASGSSAESSNEKRPPSIPSRKSANSIRSLRNRPLFRRAASTSLGKQASNATTSSNVSLSNSTLSRDSSVEPPATASNQSTPVHSPLQSPLNPASLSTQTTPMMSPLASPMPHWMYTSTSGISQTTISPNSSSFNAFPLPVLQTPATHPCVILANALSHLSTLLILQIVPPSLVSPAVLPGTAATSSVSLATSSNFSDHGAGSSTAYSMSHGSSIPSQSSPLQVPGPPSFTCPEQLSASSVQLPTTMLASVWRTLKSMDWLRENDSRLYGLTVNPNQAPPSPLKPGFITTFDYITMIQATADVAAALALQQGVELTLYHGSDPTEMSFKDGMQTGGLCEAYVRADERGHLFALSLMISRIVQDARPGSSVNLYVSTETQASSPRPSSNVPLADEDESSTEDTDDETRPPQDYIITLKVVLAQMSSNDTCSMPSPPVQICSTDEESAFQAMYKLLGLMISKSPAEDGLQTWVCRVMLPKERSPTRLRQDVTTLRRRKSVDTTLDPSLGELSRFVSSTLKGRKAHFHGSEHSAFAKMVTSYLTAWGLDVTHVTLCPSHVEHEEQEAASEAGSVRQPPSKLRPPDRGDSGYGGSSFAGGESPHTPFGFDHHQSPMSNATHSKTSHSTPHHADPAIDPNVSFIIIDDDVPTLRRQLTHIRNNAPQLHINSSLLAKRPQLQSRRTRSSTHVRQLQNTLLTIVHFTSLENFRRIKAVVHQMLKTSSPMFPLPEVLVVPKPVGPRRLLTTLHSAIKKPAIDPFFAPIATSPASPGGHYFFSTGKSPRASPAGMNHVDFDTAAGMHLAAQMEHPPSNLSAHPPSLTSGPRTPPIPLSQTGSGSQNSNPPSPLSPDAIEYFTKAAAEAGSNASGGIVIQSPDGRASGLFFQPQARSQSLSAATNQVTSPGSSSAKAKSGSGLKEIRHGMPDSDSPETESSSDEELKQTRQRSASVVVTTLPEHTSTAPTPSPINLEHAPSILTPQQIGLGPSPNRTSRSDSLSPGIEANTRALRLDSFGFPTPPADEASDKMAEANKDGDQTEPPATRSPASPISPPGSPLQKSVSSPRSPSWSNQGGRSPFSRNTIDTNLPFVGGPGTPGTPATIVGPPNANDSNSTLNGASPAGRGSVQITAKGQPTRSRRGTQIRQKSFKKSNRRPLGTIVPPISVLIVEDNPINQIILATFLKKIGIKYLVAKNGQEAVDKWKAGGIHLVLMDIQLPVKDGIEATTEIRAMEKAHNVGTFVNTPSSETSQPDPNIAVPPPSPTPGSPSELPVIIVALTASSLQEDRLKALAAGCNDFLTKPVSLTWLQQKLVEWGSMAYLQQAGGWGAAMTGKSTTIPPPDQSPRS